MTRLAALLLTTGLLAACATTEAEREASREIAKTIRPTPITLPPARTGSCSTIGGSTGCSAY